MSVKARFWIQKISRQAVSAGNINRTVELAPVIRGTGMPGAGDNVDWSKYTPSGKIELVVSADAAGQWFEDRLGQDVAITFDDVEVEQVP